MLEVVLRGLEVVLRRMEVVPRGMEVVLSSEGAQVISPARGLALHLSMITTFNTLHFYSLVHFELSHSPSFMPCFVITVVFINTPRLMYQQFLHQAMNKRAIQNETNIRELE